LIWIKPTRKHFSATLKVTALAPPNFGHSFCLELGKAKEAPCVRLQSPQQPRRSPLCFRRLRLPRRVSAEVRSNRMANVGTVRSIHPRVRRAGDIGDRVQKGRAVVVGERGKRPLAAGLDAVLSECVGFRPRSLCGAFFISDGVRNTSCN
jgi:hypothetical protein